MLSFGGHGDLPRTLRYLCTGVLPDGQVRPPHDYGVVIILLGVADRVVPAEQVEPLRQGILAFLNASHLDMVDKPRAALEFERARKLAETLPEPARTFMTWVNKRDVAHLGPALLPHVAAIGGDPALSPARNPPPSAPVYLLHGADDNVIPAAESEMLAADLRARGGRVTQLSTPLITHAEVDHPPGVGEIWRLIRFWAGPLCSPWLARPRSALRYCGWFSTTEDRLRLSRPCRDALAQQRDLARRQVAELPRADVLVGDRADAHAAEARRPDARSRRTCRAPAGCGLRESRTTAAPAVRSPLRSPWPARRRRRRPPAFERDAARQPIEIVLIGHAAHAHFVFALDAVPRMRQHAPPDRRRSSAAAAPRSRSRAARPDRRTP